MLTFSCSLPPHQQSSSAQRVDYNGKSCKAQTLLNKGFLGKHKDTEKDKNKDTWEFEASVIYSYRKH